MAKRIDHRPLLSDMKIRTWYDENALRSKLTAEVNLRQLGLFCHMVGLGPRELASLGRSDSERVTTNSEVLSSAYTYTIDTESNNPYGNGNAYSYTVTFQTGSPTVRK